MIIAWITTPHQWQRVEILDADANTKTAWCKNTKGGETFPVSFHQIETVTLYDGAHVIACYGRPPASDAPEWARS